MFNSVFQEAFVAAGSPTFTRPYCTMQDVIDECRSLQSDRLDGAMIRKFAAAINLASGQIESFCKRDFWYHNNASTPLTILPKWVAGGEIFLPYPIITLTGITANGTALTSDQYLSESSDAFSRIRQNQQNSFSLLGGFGGGYGYGDLSGGFPSAINYSGSYNGFESYWRWLAQYGLLAINGTFGWPLALRSDNTTPDTQSPPPTLPGPVRRAATLIAAAWSGENRKEFRSLEGGVSSVLDENMPKECTMILRPYVYRIN